MDLNNLDSLASILREKICNRTRGGFDQMRKIQILFACSKGIDLTHFRKVMKDQFGLRLTKPQAQALFGKFDQNRNGEISLKEFMDGLLEKDYTQKTMAETASIREQSKLKWRKADAKRGCFPQAAGLSKQRIITLLQDKITQRTRGGLDQFRKIYKLFAKADNISCEDFTRTLTNQFGLNLSPKDARTLFDHFDKTGRGTISLKEFMEELLPRDYQDALSGENFEGRSWYIQADEREKRRKQRELKTRRDEFLWGLDDDDDSSSASEARKNPLKQQAGRRDATGNKRKIWAAKHRVEMNHIMGHRFVENEQTQKQKKNQQQLGSTCTAASLPTLPKRGKNKNRSTHRGNDSCDYMNSSSQSKYSNSSKQIRAMAADSVSLPSLPIREKRAYQTPAGSSNRNAHNVRTGRDFETSIQTYRQKLSTHTGRSSGVATAKRKQLLNELRMLKSAVDAR